MIAAMSAETPSQDRALIIAARRGERRAREILGRRVGRSAFLFALQLTGDHQTSVDIAQDGVLQFFRSLNRFNEERPLEPWLYQIVRNRTRDLARRNRHRRHDSLEAWLERGNVLPAHVADDPAAAVERSELQDRIWRSVSQLPEPHREIFVLRDFHGLSYQEIAEVLAIPQGTVMSRLHAARKNLRTLLAADDPGERSG